jgi:hypothetical protein
MAGKDRPSPRWIDEDAVVSLRWCVVLVLVTLGAGSCDPGLRVGALNGGLEVVLVSNTIEPSPVGCFSTGRAELVVTNGGAEASVLLAPALSAGLSTSAALKAAKPCAQGEGLGPSQSCSVPVQGAPAAQGTRAAFVVVEGTPGGSVQQDLSVTGLPNLSATQSSVQLVGSPPDAGAPGGPSGAGAPDETVTVKVGTMPAALAPGFTGPSATQFDVSYDAGVPDGGCGSVPLHVRINGNAIRDPGIYTATLVFDKRVDGGPGIPVTLVLP